MKKKIYYLLAIVFIAIFTVAVVSNEFDNDTFYVIALGNYILDNGVDDIDHFSWHKDLKYTYPHWLFDVINASIYNVFQLDGVYYAVCLMAAVFMITIFLLMIRKKIDIIVAFGSTLIVTYFLRGMFVARGQILSYWLVLLEIPLIEKFLKDKNKLTVLRFVFYFMYSS